MINVTYQIQLWLFYEKSCCRRPTRQREETAMYMPAGESGLKRWFMSLKKNHWVNYNVSCKRVSTKDTNTYVLYRPIPYNPDRNHSYSCRWYGDTCHFANTVHRLHCSLYHTFYNRSLKANNNSYFKDQTISCEIWKILLVPSENAC